MDYDTKQYSEGRVKTPVRL